MNLFSNHRHEKKISLFIEKNLAIVQAVEDRGFYVWTFNDELCKACTVFFFRGKFCIVLAKQYIVLPLSVSITFFVSTALNSFALLYLPLSFAFEKSCYTVYCSQPAGALELWLPHILETVHNKLLFTVVVHNESITTAGLPQAYIRRGLRNWARAAL